MTTVCCVCHRTKSGKGWVKKRQIEDAWLLSHGYCPDCFQLAMERFRCEGQGRRGRVSATAGLK